jgi:2-polyprenyl-6-methoxyphenol hydroxylase-like FAD-dependent oxidoreductase
MNTSNKSDVVDLLIVGAGVAGSAVALSCAPALRRILLLHAPDEFDRIESLSPDACRMLARHSITVGVPISEIVAWWGSARRAVAPCPGARIGSRRELANQMRKAVGESAIILRCKPNISVSRKNEVWEVKFCDEQGDPTIVSAKNICDATGRRSALGRAVGASRKFFDHLCCAFVPLSDAAEIGTFTEAVFNGWWNLCSDGSRGTLAFYSTPRIIKQTKGDLKCLFEGTMELKKIASVSSDNMVGVNVCDSSLLSPCAGEGWFAVGDAAASFQPITSAGTAKALRDGFHSLAVTNGDARGYNLRYATEFESYFRELKIQYGFERRWKDSDFWK